VKLKGLSARLAIYMIIASLLMQVGHGVYRLSVDIPDARKDGVDVLNHLVASLKPALSLALSQLDQNLSDEILKTFRSYDGVFGVWLLDMKQEGVGVWIREDGKEEPEELREVTWPLQFKNKDAGYLVVLMDLSVLEQKAMSHLWDEIGFSVLMGAINLLLLYFIARRLVTKPISSLAKAVSLINVKSLKKENIEPLNRVMASDEIASLRDSIKIILSELAEHLGDNQQAMILLKEFNESLEKQVAKRTLELQKAKDAAEVAANAKTDFLNVMTHELRTPLNGVLGFSSILKKRIVDDANKQLIEGIEQAGQGLLVILSDIIDFVDLDSKPLGVQGFSVHDALSSAYKEMLPKAQAKNLELQFQVDSHLILKGDPKRLNIVVRHLLSNGIKFTEHGSVTLSAEPAENNGVLISVSDTGVGMDDELFQQFKNGMFNQKERGFERSSEGLGLGIAIVNRICRKWEGQWWFEKNQPHGIKVNVKLADLEKQQIEVA